VALNQNEKELLAIVRHYNENKKNVARLVKKLLNDFTLADVKALTGFNGDEIYQLQQMVYTPKRRKNATERLAEKLVKQDPIKGTELDGYRLAIDLNAESNVAQRVAYDIAEAIESELSPGDPFWGQKALCKKFDCTHRTAGLATRILRSHNWIEEAEPGNFRKGYVVK
jgi:hypothetical protein